MYVYYSKEPLCFLSYLRFLENSWFVLLYCICIPVLQFENGLCNGHGNEEAFPLPKLHNQHPDRKIPHEGAVPSTPPPSSLTSEAKEPRSPHTPGSSRVSRLAAIYKGTK